MSDASCITDHAVIRYLERIEGRGPFLARGESSPKAALERARAEGINIEAVRAGMWTPGLGAALSFGAARVAIGNTVFVIRERAVVTVVWRDQVRAYRGVPQRPRRTDRAAKRAERDFERHQQGARHAI